MAQSLLVSGKLNLKYRYTNIKIQRIIKEDEQEQTISHEEEMQLV